MIVSDASLRKKIKLPKLGFVKVKQSKPLGGRIISATVRRTPSDKYYVSLLVEEPTLRPYKKTGSEVGIDLGVKDLLVISNNEIVENIKPYISLEKALAKAQHSLSRKVKGSNNYNKSKVKIARIHEKISNIRLDYLHKVTTNLVKNHDLICIEDLDVIAMLKDKNLSKHVCDVSFGKLKELLEYKAEWYGKVLVKVDRYFPSSQLCSSCGFQNKAVKDIAIRHWECPECQSKHDRDYNASLNIIKEGRKNYSLTQTTVGTTEIA